MLLEIEPFDRTGALSAGTMSDEEEDKLAKSIRLRPDLINFTTYPKAFSEAISRAPPNFIFGFMDLTLGEQVSGMITLTTALGIAYIL